MYTTCQLHHITHLVAMTMYTTLLTTPHNISCCYDPCTPHCQLHHITYLVAMTHVHHIANYTTTYLVAIVDYPRSVNYSLHQGAVQETTTNRYGRSSAIAAFRLGSNFPGLHKLEQSTSDSFCFWFSNYYERAYCMQVM